MTEAPLRLGRPHPPADQGPVITGSIEAAARPVPRRSDAGKIRYTERDVTGLLLLAGHHGRGRPLIKKGEMTSGATIAALLYVLSESTD